MRFDLDAVAPEIAYKLLAATVIPRPIAWVVTLNPEGGVNAAPYSFFNVMGSSPPTVVLGIMAAPDRGFKDSARNIIEGEAFVINLVPEALVEAMNLTAADAPRGTDEAAFAGLETAPSTHIAPPRIAESPVAFECVKHSTIETGPHQVIVIGRVLAVHIADRFVKDAERGHVLTDALDLVGRSFGASYIRTHDTFDLARPTWAGLTEAGLTEAGMTGKKT